MKFTFRLEPVLKKRLENEENAILAQAHAQREYHEQLTVLQDIQINAQQFIDNSGKNLSLSGLMAGSLYFDYLKEAEARNEEVLEEKRKILDLKREDVIEASKDRMILQKLKENLREKFIHKKEKIEDKILDDQCTVFAHRNKAQ